MWNWVAGSILPTASAEMFGRPVTEGSRRHSDVVDTATVTESIGEVHLRPFLYPNSH